jgi:hypothetical protein
VVKAEKALPLTCVQAWVESGKSYPEMLVVVKTLARVSLANRDLTLPNSREAGLDVGRGIAEDCKADPNALLFAIIESRLPQRSRSRGSSEDPAGSRQRVGAR